MVPRYLRDFTPRRYVELYFASINLFLVCFERGLMIGENATTFSLKFGFSFVFISFGCCLDLFISFLFLFLLGLHSKVYVSTISSIFLR